MPIRTLCVHYASILGLLLLSALAMQGCLAIVWLGAVGIDMTRTSDIEFRPFENSSVVAPQRRRHLESVKSIAVLPFVGDPVMAERWAAVLQDLTDLRVESPSVVMPSGISEHERIELTQRMSAEFQVDCVLFGSVANQEPQKSFAGLKESSSRRLFLHLVSAAGTLLWKTELPYTMVKGDKDLDEQMVTQALLTHVRAYGNELGLADLGASNQRTASQSLHDGFDQLLAQPSPIVERPSGDRGHAMPEV